MYTHIRPIDSLMDGYMMEERLSVKELLARYNLKSKQTLYNWLKTLNIKLEKTSRNRAFATPEQIRALDDLKAHLEKGGLISEYVPITSLVVKNQQDYSLDSPIDIQLDYKSDLPLDNSLDSPVELLQQALDSLAEAVSTPKDPMWAHKALMFAQENELLLSTSEVWDLIGVSPKGDVFQRGSWVFTKKGKIGWEGAWLVYRAVNPQ